MSLSRSSSSASASASTSNTPASSSFFETERQRLIADIGAGFEDLMTHTNVLNRKLEEVYGVGKEFGSVAALWGQFLNMIDENKVSKKTRRAAVRRVDGRRRARWSADASAAVPLSNVAATSQQRRRPPTRQCRCLPNSYATVRFADLLVPERSPDRFWRARHWWDQLWRQHAPRVAHWSVLFVVVVVFSVEPPSLFVVYVYNVALS